MNTSPSTAESAEKSPQQPEGAENLAPVIDISSAAKAGVRAEADAVLSEGNIKLVLQTAVQELIRIQGELAEKPTFEEYKAACKQVFECMERCVGDGLIDKNDKGRFEANTDDAETLLATFLAVMKELREKKPEKPKAEEKQEAKPAPKKPEKKPVKAKREAVKLEPAKKLPNPLAITMSDGRIFENRQGLERFVDLRTKKLKSRIAKLSLGEEADDEIAKLEERIFHLTQYREEYYEALKARLEELEGMVTGLRDRVKEAVKLQRSPSNPNSKPGLRDMLAPLIEQGLIAEENGYYRGNPDVNLAGNLVKDANERVRMLKKAGWLRHQPSGYAEFDKNKGYVCRIEVSKDDKTGRTKYKVSDIIVIYGEADLQEGEFLDFEALNKLKLAAAKTTLQKKESDKKQPKKKGKGKAKK